MRITKEEKEILEKLKLRTYRNYGCDEFYEIDSNKLIEALEDAVDEIEHLEEKYRELDEFIQNEFIKAKGDFYEYGE